MPCIHTQQDEVYAAELGAKVWMRGETFTSIDDVQLFLDSLREERWWPIQVRRVEAYKRRGGRSVGYWEASKGAGAIELRELTMHLVIHELAHVLAAAVHKSNAHDPWYCRTYLELCYRVCGSDAYLALRESFERHGVIHDPEVL